MSSSPLHYGFLDESGTVGREKGYNYFVVALASVNRPRVLEAPIRRILKKIQEKVGARRTESVQNGKARHIAAVEGNSEAGYFHCR